MSEETTVMTMTPDQARHARDSAIVKVRRLTRMRLRLRGYTKEQATRLAAEPGDQTIWDKIQAAWVKYGPTIMALLKVVFEFLPLIMAKEAPKGHPVTGDTVPRDLIDEEDEALLAIAAETMTQTPLTP